MTMNNKVWLTPPWLLLIALACHANLEQREHEVQVGSESLVACGATTPCSTGQTCCSGFCVDLQRNPNHCGACGTACSASQGCCNGSCTTRNVSSGALAGTVAGSCNALRYRRYANREQSNASHVLPDFSHAGYLGGGVRLPHAVVRETVSPGAGDDRARIQGAIDRVSARQPDGSGLRGAVYLKRGTYEIGDPLRITASGVVLRGEGQGLDGTVLTATKAEAHALIEIEGEGDGLDEIANTRTRIVDSLVPVGSTRFEVESGSYAVGDTISVVRTPNDAWIEDIHMDASGFDKVCAPGETEDCSRPWTADSYAIAHPRTVVAVSGRRLTVDIPLVDTIEDAYGGGEIFERDPTAGHLRRVGIESLRLVSSFASATDESHGWDAVSLLRTNDSWVRRVTAVHFGHAAVLLEQSNFNTVEEVAHLDPISQNAGNRRYSFYVVSGTGNLFQRCFSRNSRHSFVTSSRVAGPNVWLDSLAVETLNDDGPHHRWATGLLYDNIKTDMLHVQNRKDWGSGHGWSGAQVMFWNSEADQIISDAPAGAMNWVVGGIGTKTEGSQAREADFGIWESHGSHVSPRSLYLKQLEDRLGPGAVSLVTTPAQRSGDIYDDLERWAGQGELYPDADCTTGIESGQICCPASCGTCGGDGCSSRDGDGGSCCTGGIKESGRSCLEYGPPCLLPDPDCDTATLNGNVCGGSASEWRSCSKFPPPCIVSDPECARGIEKTGACCNEACGACGGASCSQRPGGSAACCSGTIVAANDSCTENSSPCELSDPECRTGIRSGNVCCEKACGRCGGSACSSLPGGGSACCSSGISASGRSCNDHMPPCIIE